MAAGHAHAQPPAGNVDRPAIGCRRAGPFAHGEGCRGHSGAAAEGLADTPEGAIALFERGETQAENAYLHVKWSKKGSGHVLFKRPDLVEKMNGILAKHYPHALASEVR